MHLTDDEVAALAHDRAETLHADRAAHGATCTACAARVDAAQHDDRETAALLRWLDHPVPAVSVDRVIEAAARERPRRLTDRWQAPGRRAFRPRLVAAALVVGAGAAAAALPNGPLHRVLAQALSQAVSHAFATGRPADVPTTTQPVPTPPEIAPATGIAIAAGTGVDVALQSWQRTGRLRIVFTDTGDASLVATGADATFSIRQGRIIVDNRGASSTFTLTLPRTVPRVRIQVDTSVVFRKGPTGIVARAWTRRGDEYELELGLTAPRR